MRGWEWEIDIEQDGTINKRTEQEIINEAQSLQFAPRPGKATESYFKGSPLTAAILAPRFSELKKEQRDKKSNKERKNNTKQKITAETRTEQNRNKTEQERKEKKRAEQTRQTQNQIQQKRTDKNTSKKQINQKVSNWLQGSARHQNHIFKGLQAQQPRKPRAQERTAGQAERQGEKEQNRIGQNGTEQN